MTIVTAVIAETRFEGETSLPVSAGDQQRPLDGSFVDLGRSAPPEMDLSNYHSDIYLEEGRDKSFEPIWLGDSVAIGDSNDIAGRLRKAKLHWRKMAGTIYLEPLER